MTDLRQHLYDSWIPTNQSEHSFVQLKLTERYGNIKSFKNGNMWILLHWAFSHVLFQQIKSFSKKAFFKKGKSLENDTRKKQQNR